MKCVFGLAIVALVCVILIEGYGQRNMDDEKYHIKLLVKGRFSVQVKQRTKAQRAAYVRYWRNRERYSIIDDKLLFDGKIVNESDMKTIVHERFRESKGSGPRRLKYQLKGGYCGMSEANVKKVLDQSATYQRLNARFANSVPIRPIRAKEVHGRHQVDLVDVQKLKSPVQREKLPIHYVTL